MAIVLRPFRSDDFEQVWRARVADGGMRRDANARRRLKRRTEHSGALWHGILELGVEVDGRLVGDVQARQPDHALPPGVFELGIDLYDPADRGRGYGRVAVELLTERLFANEGAERVQASTFVENRAMRRVLERLGFTYEGTLRGFMPSGEGRDDYAMYGVTRADWATRPQASGGSPSGAPAAP